jgi:hypothetical protein
VLDLRVCEEKRDIVALLARVDVEAANIFEKGIVVVVLRDNDLKLAGLLSESGEPRQRLLPRAAHADEHG